MIRHIVLLRPAPGTPQGTIEKIVGELDPLVSTIPGMIDVHLGTNVNTLPGLDQGYTHAFTVDFADAAARETYYASAEHLSVAQQLAPLFANGLDDLMMFQIEL